MTDSDDLDGLRVVAHPLRLRLLSLLTGESLSAAEAARALGETQANVSYHLRRLAQAGLVQLVEETRVRGGTAKRYRHDPASGEALSAGPTDDVAALLSALASQLAARSSRYRDGTRFTFTDVEVALPPGAWERVRGLADEAGRILHDEAVAADSPDAVRVASTIALFEVAAERAPGRNTAP
ncbi:ArsR/SmtB family transcription factor [Labedella endophytica]|uniref:Transcriptional regulator n=1 Tax=Labedella endophytica TaxID=1523160 RepID=A0A433JVN7_9MICO|nr:helix-turn-helix domain-containing protein [Labedella endophytica]RUR03043.1 transcriptional regulator [Labedella endophytica]